MNENIAALIFAILKNTTQEQSFKALAGEGYTRGKCYVYGKKDYEDMAMLYLQGVPQIEITEYYQVSKYFTCRKIREYMNSHSKKEIREELSRRKTTNKNSPVESKESTKDIIKSLVKKGYTSKEIATETGFCYQHILRIRKEFNV